MDKTTPFTIDFNLFACLANVDKLILFLNIVFPHRHYVLYTRLYVIPFILRLKTESKQFFVYRILRC